MLLLSDAQVGLFALVLPRAGVAPRAVDRMKVSMGAERPGVSAVRHCYSFSTPNANPLEPGIEVHPRVVHVNVERLHMVSALFELLVPR